ncbi:hypothetical protein E4U15_001834 [Claviceps sp. LM218 group G6]|nr:hypothetical protein E4U15_001834 [Claviceps sp. LM218 group G6]
MDIDSGTRGLAQSRHHPLSGLGSVNVETVSPEANAVRERVPQQLRTDFDIIARLVQPSALEGVWNKRGSDARRERDHRATALRAQQQHYYDRKPGPVSRKAYPKGPTSFPEGPRKAPKGPPKGGTTWASIAARGAPGPSGSYNPPPMAVPSRLHREVLIKGTSINSNVSGRSPGEIVKAVNAAIKTDTAVAARRLPSGDTLVTFRDSTSRPNADDTEWVQTAFGPEAAVNRRVFSVVVKGFPVRLSQNQDRGVIRKELAASGKVPQLLRGSPGMVQTLPRGQHAVDSGQGGLPQSTEGIRPPPNRRRPLHRRETKRRRQPLP